MEPRIEKVAERKLVGAHRSMSFARPDVSSLWSGFMQSRREIKNPASSDLISMAVYGAGYFSSFDPARSFEKWAAIEVLSFEDVPQGMDTFILPSGLYAVFHYRGLNTDPSVFEHIFKVWLPHSDYELDDRPHFEVLGDKYKNHDPSSEEDIFIPVTPRA